MYNVVPLPCIVHTKVIIFKKDVLRDGSAKNHRN